MSAGNSSSVFEVAKAVALASFVAFVLHMAGLTDWKFPKFEMPEKTAGTVSQKPVQSHAAEQATEPSRKFSVPKTPSFVPTETPAAAPSEIRPNDGNTVVFWTDGVRTNMPASKYVGYVKTASTRFPGCSENDLAFSWWQVWSACDLRATVPYGNQPFSDCTGKGTPVDCAKAVRGKWLGSVISEKSAATACPKGYRLPVKRDFEILVERAGGAPVNGKEIANVRGNLDLFTNVLKMPFWGYVTGSNSEYYAQGREVDYWYADPSGKKVSGFLFVTGDQAFDLAITWDGSLRYVRCIRQ